MRPKTSSSRNSTSWQGDLPLPSEQRVDIDRKASAYLAAADRLLPGWITDFYVVGSGALGEYVPRRSDLDFVAVVDGAITPRRLIRPRLLHIAGGIQGIVQSRTGGTPNGVFVTRDDVSAPVTAIRPVASHTAQRFAVGKAFDVNPVVWKVLAERGIRIRGRNPGELGLDWQPEVFRQWNLDNLEAHWRPLGRRMARGELKKTWSGLRYGYAWGVGWCTLGAPRLHCSVATGHVVGKRTAGQYALDTFGSEWHPIIELGLRWWHRALTEPVRPDHARRAGEFVEVVADSAQLLLSG